MKIQELKPNEKVQYLVATIAHLSEPEEREIKGKTVKVQDGILEDSTGQVRVSFWDKWAGMHKVGDKVSIVGFCKEFQEDLQVTTGMYGKAEKVPDIAPVNK